MSFPELPRPDVPEPDAAADAQRRANHSRRRSLGGIGVALVALQWLFALGAGFWTVVGCAPVDSALPFLAGAGMAGSLMLGQSAALALAWVGLIINLPRLWRWIKAPVGTPLPESRSDTMLDTAMIVVAVGGCLLGAIGLAAVMTVLLPGCSAVGLWLRVLGVAVLVSIPTPMLMRSGSMV